MSLVLIIFTFAVVACIAYFQWHKGYWKRKGITGPDSAFFLGNFWKMTDRTHPQVLVFKKWTEKFGKVYGIQEGTRKFLVVSDTTMLQEMFVKKFDQFYGRKNMAITGDIEKDPRVHVFEAEGIRWKRLRTIAAPTFSSGSLRKIMSTVQESSLELVNQLSKQENEPVNIHSYYKEFTMDVISRLVMGQKTSTFFKNPSVGYVEQIFGRSFRNPVFMLAAAVPQIRVQLRWFFLAIGKLRRSVAIPLFKMIYDAIDERSAHRNEDAQNGIEPGEPEDFIDLFLDARADDASFAEQEQQYSKTNVKITKFLTREEIAAQCFVFLLAGFDTTANALAYTSWLFARYPETMKKAQLEVDDVFEGGETLTYDKITKLKYIENAMKEALRLYPLGSFAASRTCMESTTLGEYEIEKGTCVLADLWTIQRDKNIWGENAEEFVPERWEDPSVGQNMTWLPFGAGPRVCIGMRLAYMEEKLALAHILRRYDIVSGPKTEESLKLYGTATVSPVSTTVYLKLRPF